MPDWIGSTAFTGLPWIGSSIWAYPVLEVLHIIGIASLLGSLLVLDLRVWGAQPDLPVASLARLSLRLTVAGFGLALLSGLLMFSAHPNELIANRAFVVKMGLLMMAGINAAHFHARGGLRRLDRAARLQTALSLGVWVGVIICGRWIAYL
ncbi:MAG: hypothetical protein ABIN96_05630 [Rubrivivax sp.]